MNEMMLKYTLRYRVRAVANWIVTKKVMMRSRQKREYSAPNSARGFGAAGAGAGAVAGLRVGSKGVSSSERGSS